MFEINEGGADPPSSDIPTEAIITKPVFLPHRIYSDNECQRLALSLTGIDPQSVRHFSVGQDCKFWIGHVTQSDLPGFYLYTESQSHLNVNGLPIHTDANYIANILSNYLFGGQKAVDAYLDSIPGA